MQATERPTAPRPPAALAPVVLRGRWDLFLFCLGLLAVVFAYGMAWRSASTASSRTT
jgi:hypothetical protein